MEMHIILIFSLILMLALYTLNALFYLHYQKQKEINATVGEYLWKGMLSFLAILFFGLLTPLNIFIITDYILLMTLSTPPPILSYLYVILGVMNYGLILIYLIIQTIFTNSLWIKVDDEMIYFLDETINISQIIGLDKSGICMKILYQIDGEQEKKVIIGKKTFAFLVQIQTPN